MLDRVPPPLALSAGNTTVSGSGTLSFADGGGVSFGLAGSTLTASVATNYQSSGNYLTTAMASNRGSDFVQAAAVFNGTNASGTIASGALSISVGNYLTTGRASTDALGLNTAKTNVTWTANSSGLSLDAGGYAGTGFTSTTTAGTAIVGTNNTAGLSIGVPAYLTAAAGAFSAGVSTGGNTSGNTGVTGTRLVFAGGNNVTVSQGTDANGATITISGANAGGAQTGISGVGVSNTTYSSGTVIWSAQANVTLNSSVNGGSQYVQVSVGPYITTADLSQNSSKYVQDWKLTGNTAGTTSSAQGTDFWLSGGQGITLSGSSNTIVLSVGSYITTADLSANSSNYVRNWKLTGNTAGTTSSAQGTDLWLAGGNGVTVSGSSNTLSFSVATNYQSQGAYLTTADLSANSSQYFRNWKLTGNTAGTTSSQQGTDFWLAGGQGITVSGNSNTVSLSVGSYITTGRASTDALGLNTAKTNVTWTANSSGLSLDAGGYAGTGFTSTTTAGTAIVGTNNTAGLSIGVPAYLTAAAGAFSAGISTGGNTAGSTGITGTQLVLVGTGVVSLSQSTGANGGTLSIAVPATSSLSATGALSISTNGSTISIGVVAQTNQAGSFYAVGNTFGTSSGTYDARTLSISVGSGLQIAASNSGWVIGEQLLSFYEPVSWEGAQSATSTGGLGTLHVWPFALPYPGSFNQLMMIQSHTLTSTTAGNTATVSLANSTQSVNYQATYTISNSQFVDLFLFSKGGGGSSTNLMTYSSTRNSFVTLETHTYNISATRSSYSLSSSVSVMVSFPAITSATSTSGNAATTVTLWGTGYSTWTSSVSTSNSTTGVTNVTTSISQAGAWPATTAWASNKLVNHNFAVSLSGGEWWLGVRRMSSTSSSSSSASTGGNALATFTIAVNASNLTLSANATTVGFTNSLASSLATLGGGPAASLGPWPAAGSFSVATYDPATTYVNNAGQPAGAIALSDVLSNVSYFRPWFQFGNYRV